MTKPIHRAALACVLLACAATAGAGIKADHVRTTPWISDDADGAYVPLNNAGATTISFNNGSNTKKVLSYSATCQLLDRTTTADRLSLYVEVQVNGVAIAPTIWPYGLFCYRAGHSDVHIARATLTMAVPVIAGANTVRIFARPGGPVRYFILSDTTLLVHD